MVVLGMILIILSAAGCSDSDDTVSAPTGAAPCMDEPPTANRFQECEKGGNGTVTDTLTGLIWLKAGDCFDRENYDAARAAAGGLKDGACGLTDGSSAGEWRLPTKEEWEAIVVLPETACDFGDVHLPNAAGDACWSDSEEEDAFTGAYASAYWSVTSGSSSSFAWIVYLHDAYFTPDVKTDRNYVWAVRSF